MKCPVCKCDMKFTGSFFVEDEESLDGVGYYADEYQCFICNRTEVVYPEWRDEM